MPVAKRKEHRFHLRATERDVSTISRAAATAGISVSTFILESASERAERTLADQRHFVLSDEQWRAFTDALDRPARHLPELEKLLREPSILERAGADFRTSIPGRSPCPVTQSQSFRLWIPCLAERLAEAFCLGQPAE